MSHPTSESAQSSIHVLLGFLLGVVAGIGCLIFSIFLGSTFGPYRGRIYLGINAILLLCFFAPALRRSRQSKYALGAMIALALALLLDATYALVRFR